MGLFIFLIVVVCIAYLLFFGKNSEGNNAEALMGKDDFAGGSIRSFFLLEEIVDSGGGEQRSINQDFSQGEPMEDDFFEGEVDYFEDEFFE